MDRILTLLGVIVLALALLFNFVPIAGGNAVVLMVAIGALLIGIGVLTGK